MRADRLAGPRPSTTASVRLHAVRRSLLAAVAIGGLLVAQVLTAPIASAHDALVASAPADGTEVATSPAAVTLTFNGPVSTQFSEVTVTGPDGAGWQLDTATVSGAIVTQPLAEEGPAGTYEVAWRVVSADGHPISGAFSYVVTTGPTTSAAPAPSTASAPPAESSQPAATATPPEQSVAEAAPAAATTPDDGTNVLAIVLILVVLLVALGISAVVVSRRRGTVGRGG